jgi:hypothetical protein
MPNLTNSSRFNAQVLKAIDEGAEILGDARVKQAFFYHVEKRLKTKREGIPTNLQAFHKALFDLFDQGAVILERRIARILYDQFGIEFVAHDGWSLLDYVKHAELQSMP